MNKRLDQSLPKLLLSQFLEFWYYYLGALIALVATHYIQSELPFLAKELADNMAKGIDVVSYKQFFVLAIGIIFFRTSSRLLFFYPARVLEKFLRLELVEGIQNASPFRYKDFPEGQIFQVISADMEQMRALIGFALLQVGNIIVALSILAPRLAAFDKNLLIALLPMLICFLFFTLFVSRNRKYYAQTQQLQGKLNDTIIEAYNGKKTIKNFHAEKDFISLFNATSVKELYNFYKAGIGVAISIPLVPFGVGLSLLWGAHIVFQNQTGANSLILFSGFVFLFLEPLMFLSWIGVVAARSIESWKRIKKLNSCLYETSNEEILLSKLNPISKDQYRIPFWDGEIQFDLKRDQWLVFVGDTGCGKTHIIKYLVETLKSHKKVISYVAQNPYLYSDSLANNIFLGLESEKRDYELAYELLDLFGLTYLANNKEELFKLEVGENGKKVSGGQAKRLALIRSLMSDAEYIVWDDPFSSVDVILEKQIVDKLKEKEILKNKYVILTSHRLLTVKQSDELILLQKQKGIIEKGAVADFLKNQNNGVYEYFKNQMV